jgi:hypothetical protein
MNFYKTTYGDYINLDKVLYLEERSSECEPPITLFKFEGCANPTKEPIKQVMAKIERSVNPTIS